MNELTLLERALAILELAWEHPDWFIYGLSVLSAMGWATWRWLWPQLRAPAALAPSNPSFPFEVVKPKGEPKRVLKTLMGSDQADDDPLADFNIPYQQRQSDTLTQEQLGRLLDVHRWLLVLGRTGLGKTREAAELAQRLNGEGWTVLKLKNAEQLVVPTQFPTATVGERPRLLFFLDNLNQAMVLGNVALERKTGEALSSALKQPLQDRLKETLEFFEQSCGTDRVRVIATARNETILEKDGQPSEWDKLAIERYSGFWRQFHCHELPVPEERAIAAVLSETTQQAELPAVTEDFDAIARKNDGTFRNVVENLERTKTQNLTVANNTYKDTLRGTWQSRYQTTTQRDPAAKYIYDAVDVLRQCNVELHDLTVLSTAALLARRTKPWHLWQRYTLRRSLHRLNQTERILQPRDGQIEAKSYAVDLGEHLAQVGKLLLRLAKQHPECLENSLFGFVVTTSSQGRYRDALRVNTQLVKLQPNNEVVWYNQAWLRSKLGDNAGAIAFYQQALAIKPDDYEVLNNIGLALSDIGDKEGAIARYDDALAIKPDDHKAFNNVGLALSDIGDKEGAIACYDAALAIKPDYFEALNNKGTVLCALGDIAEAIAYYDRALIIKPDSHEVLNNKGVALSALGRKEGAIAKLAEGIAYYDQAMAIRPDSHEALFNKARSYSTMGDVANAVTALQKAIQIFPQCREMAKADTGFDSIRHNERFRSLVEGE